ncbi:MAG: DUF3382 domain-containing protein, partial [Pseudomonadota bacterium]
MADTGKTRDQRLVSALTDSLLAAIIAFALFSLVLGLRTVDGATGLTLEPRPGLLLTVVAIVFFGRLALNLFVWQTEYPLTTPFAKLFNTEPFDQRDLITLGVALALGSLCFVTGLVFGEAVYELLGIVVLLFVGLGMLRRWLVQRFPSLPYAQIFIAGGIL